MARGALGPAALTVVQAVDRSVPLDDALLVACSGGCDSLSLALASQVVAQRRGVSVRAVVVDHGLQPGSADVAGAVADQLASRAVPSEVVRAAVRPAAAGVEAAAREARYAALVSAARPGEVVLLGHTLDDQAETVLLGLARGSGIRSLAGMAPEVRRAGVRLLRPLLALRRETTRAACSQWGAAVWDDPHNALPDFARVRVRRSVLPVLERELGPGIAEALARTAQLARADADELDAQVDALAASVCVDGAARDPADVDRADVDRPDIDRADGNGALVHCAGLDCAKLARLPVALRLRVLRRWLHATGAPETSAANVLAVDGLITCWHGQRGVDVPGVTVRRVDGLLIAHPGGLDVA